MYQESTEMVQNNNIVGYTLMPARGAQQVPPVGQTNYLLPFTLVEVYSHQRPDRRLINDHKLTMGIPHHPKNNHPHVSICWWDAVKDQMLGRGYISDNWHFSDTAFQQIVAGMRKLKPACDELATASAANNMGSMEEIDETVLQLVIVFVMGQGGAGFHFVTPPLLRPGVNSLPFLPAPYDTGPWPGCGAGRVFYFPC